MKEDIWKGKGNMMNETLQTIKNRFSCRSYTGAAIEKEKVEAIALAAVQSPSGMNRQPWKILVLQNKALIEEMDDALMEFLSKQEDTSAYERMMSRGGNVFYNAPCAFIIAKQEGMDLDCGIVSENIALAASSLGLGNVICGMMGMAFMTEKGVQFKEKLIPEGYEFGVAVLVGYAAAEGTPHEVDMEKIVYLD